MSIFDLCLRHAYAKVRTHAENFHVFSYVIQRNEILAYGANVRADHTTIYKRVVGARETNTLHAEYVAFRRAQRRLHGKWSLINIRICDDLSVRLSKPCPVCQNFLRAVGCDKVEYTIDAANTGVLRF